MPQRDFFDVALIVPLEEELNHLKRYISIADDLSTKEQFRFIARIENCDLRILVALQRDMGRGEAFHSANKILTDFDLNLLVSIGIAGSISKDIALGDVCYTGTIIDVYNNAKMSDTPDENGKIRFSPVTYATPRNMTMALNFSRLSPSLSHRYEDWQRERIDRASEILPESAEKRPPRTTSGSIACGVVSASLRYNEALLTLDRRILAIDTESGGVFEAALARETDALTIRGISDYADHNKAELEKHSKGLFRQLAIENAASFAAHQLAGGPLHDYLIERRGKGGVLPFAAKAQSESPLGLLQRIAEKVDARLRERSPEFRLQPKGYQLPTPRVQPLDFTGPLGSAQEGDSLEFREALRATSAALVRVPRNYPDHSLPWVIENDLLTASIDGKQLVPIVVDGARFTPPSSSLAEEIRSFTDGEGKTDDVGDLVFVFDGVPLTSRTRLNLIADQCKTFSGARFIFLIKEGEEISEEGQFAARMSAEVFSLCEVSFLQIADFLQKNFAMAAPESEVVALRLHETFDRFDLYAHPSYFAGIPREIISSLLQANRRSELIQLAVDGLLSFAVADDKSDVLLSRTTRTRFLRKLALALRIEKLRLDRSDVVKFTMQFADLHDFEIDPLSFVQSFVSQGILHFDSEYVALSLSYLEAYLLALELREDDHTALKYFSQFGSIFDSQTFDIYCELGPSPLVVCQVLKRVATELEESESKNGAGHILMTNLIFPTYLRSSKRLVALQKRLNKATDDVRENRGDKEEKQRLLDFADKVRSKTAERTEEVATNRETEIADELRRLQKCINTWYVGSILLGSSAEHLTATEKRELATALVRLASSIVDRWSRHNLNLDFVGLKNGMLKDEVIDELQDEDGPSREETKVLLSALLDILEFSFLSEPFRRTISWLCEQARHKVLRGSLKAVVVSDLFEKLIHALWLADVDCMAGKELLRDAARELPPFVFVRTNLAAHLLTRVYWNHWAQAERLVLLNIADEILRPVKMEFEKPELKRMIERSNPIKGRRRRRGGRKNVKKNRGL